MAVADRTSELLLASYEAFPYESTAIAASYPDTLATAAILRGMTTPDPRSCRVLELGCGTGGNVIAMAVSLPGATFVGLDLSPRQIAAGRRMADELGLTNLRLEAGSIAAVGDDLGTFDYIICHGVYSWVPPAVQAAVLRVCSRNLAADGIAYVSYNTYPGWHVRGIVRDLIRFHDRADLRPADRVARAREIVELVARSVPESKQVYQAIVKEELLTLREAGDSYLLHEEMETVNEPLYFTEFVRRAKDAGLDFLAEAKPSPSAAMLTGDTRAAIAEHTRDEIQFEQYVDFMTNRTFRQSLLCHTGTRFHRQPSMPEGPGVHVRGLCAVDPSDAEGSRKGVEVFRTHSGLAVTIEHPLVRAALHALMDARPAALAMGDLWERTRERLGAARIDGGSPAELADAMLRCSSVRLVQLHVAPSVCATRLSERPVASPMARLQARGGSLVTSLTHLTIELSPFDRVVLANADGSRDARDLTKVVGGAVSRGEVADDGRSASSGDIGEAVARALQTFLRVGLLVA